MEVRSGKFSSVPEPRTKMVDVALRDIAAILFGLAAFVVPGITLLFLTTLFAVYAFVDGVFALVAGLHWKWWILSALGVIGIVAGIFAFF